jgi:hypothetical protein
VASWADMVGDPSRRGAEARRVTRRRAPRPAPLPLACRLRRMRRAMLERARRPRFHPRAPLPRRRAVALQWIRHEDTRTLVAPVETRAEAARRRGLVAPPWHQTRAPGAVLSHGPPSVMARARARPQDLLPGPWGPGSRTTASALVGLSLPACTAPRADGLLRDDHAAGEPPLFDVAVAEAEALLQPAAVADALGRNAVGLIGVGWHAGVHGRSIRRLHGRRSAHSAHEALPSSDEDVTPCGGCTEGYG